MLPSDELDALDGFRDFPARAAQVHGGRIGCQGAAAVPFECSGRHFTIALKLMVNGGRRVWE